MYLSLLILRLDPAHLRILCSIGFATGLITFLFGLRLSRKAPKNVATVEPVLQSEVHDSPTASHSSDPDINAPQVIHLSLPAIELRSTAMTQQEKVAAALIRAGIANPAAWTNSSAAAAIPNAPAGAGSNSVAVAEPLSSSQPQISAASQPSTQTVRSRGYTFLLWIGPVLALISLYTLLRLR